MGLFILGAIAALFIGMKFARLLDGSRSARADHQKAKGGLPGARKKAYGKTFEFVRFAAVIALALIAVVYGWVRSEG
ncbi:hypothetical protein [Winogradskya humida]|uniref:Uncharacterized protein n=1 Tax=Winogradskya humida TaxID=113566 RepID=A0ABQ4A2S8_9ACTN|nr:hypothetical protein [Actinoplanes humidus]GIE25144.1 hypothetical protein Ahu01nite_082460 [Actinoplanes humidus]